MTGTVARARFGAVCSARESHGAPGRMPPAARTKRTLPPAPLFMHRDGLEVRHAASARAFSARFISSKPRVVSLSIAPTNGTSTPRKRSLWT